MMYLLTPPILLGINLKVPHKNQSKSKQKEKYLKSENISYNLYNFIIYKKNTFISAL